MERTIDQSKIETLARHQQAMDQAIHERRTEERRTTALEDVKDKPNAIRERDTESSVTPTGERQKKNAGS